MTTSISRGRLTMATSHADRQRERKQVIGWAVGCHISRVYLCYTHTDTHIQNTHTHTLTCLCHQPIRLQTAARHKQKVSPKHTHTQIWDEMWCVRCADPANEDRRNINGATRPLLWQLAPLTQVGSTMGLSCYMFTFPLFVTHSLKHTHTHYHALKTSLTDSGWMPR